MARKKNYQAYEPERCWVGEQQKIVFHSREEAEMAARVAEYDHGLQELDVYHCEYGDHWHITTAKHR